MKESNVLFSGNGKRLLLAAIVIGFVFITSIPGFAAQVTLAWDKAYSDTIAGYHVYSGQSGTSFKSTPNTTVNSPDLTNCKITNLEAGFEYSFAVTAFDADGNESDFTPTIKHFIKHPSDIDDDGDGYTENQGDCDDANPAYHPSATEVCGDGIDQDCSGSDLTCTPQSDTQTMVFGDIPGADFTGTIQDTFLNINYDVNIASSALNTYTWPLNSPANAVLIKFDLSKLPAGAQVQTATLTLYQTIAGGDAAYDVSVHKIINHNPDLHNANGYTYDGVNQWTANNSSHNNIPLAQSDFAPAEDVNTLDLSLGYAHWDVTDMVQDWVSDSASNYGLALNSDSIASSDSYRTFAASESSDAARRPSLKLTYTINAVDIDKDADGYTEEAGDCNDNDMSIHPGATDICNDGIDQDCNGSDLACPEDIDDDKDGYTENQGDCNDSDPSIHPAASETCGDGIDQDCNGSDLVCPEDTDNDKDGYTENQGDCNDSDPSIHPAASETCGDGIDQDCNGSDLVCPKDTDNDKDGYTENQGDCNDTDLSIHPAATEICGDGIDQDCSGADQDCTEEPQTAVFGDAQDTDYPGSTQDTFINLNQDVNVFNETLATYTWPKNKPANAVLLKFDLSRLPAGAQIQSAMLTLYQTAAGGDATYDVAVHKVINVNPEYEYASGYSYDGTNEWTSNQASFRNIPLAQADIASVEYVNSLDQSGGYKNWVVTSMVRDWVTDSAANYGMLLNSDAVAGANSYRYFAASEASDADQRPTLEVVYTIQNEDIDQDGDGYTSSEGDCNDNDAMVFPDAIEICGDGIDQNCDGEDQGCTVVLGDTPNADYTGALHDTFLNINQDVNVSSDMLNTYTWPANMPANAILIKFDLSWLPAGAQIQSATLRLYQIAAGGDAAYDVSVHKLIGVNPDLEHATGYTYDGLNQWDSNNISYRSIPLAQANIAPAGSVNSLDDSLGYKDWDLTSIVSDWASEPISNYGVMLNSDAVASGESYRYFAATEAEDVETRPELVISYSVPANE